MNKNTLHLIESPLDNICFPEIDISEIAKEFGEISFSGIFENIQGETLCEKKTEKKQKPQAKKLSRKKS